MAQLPATTRTALGARDACFSWRAAGERVALVPTMGALHEGHLALVETAAQRVDRVIVSIFVNPTQFAPGEDLLRYPRDEDEDLRKLSSVPCDLVYLPSAEEIYPQGAGQMVINLPFLGSDLEGAVRPHFFSGVATLVAKLFLQVMPDIAVFGEKDYQQLLLIKALTRDLHMPIKVVAAPTRREVDGLAMSSRNAYLSNYDRALAPKLYERMCEAKTDLEAGLPVSQVRRRLRARLLQDGFSKIDYVAVRNPNNLQAKGPGALMGEARLLCAVRLGETRLIDNIAINIEADLGPKT